MVTDQVWLGDAPKKCDMCGTDIDYARAFVDGKTVFGPWAIMCPTCHRDNGGRLGDGFGQCYEKFTYPSVVWKRVTT